MEKEFVPYELALRLKALGFDEPCFHLDGLGKVSYAEFGYGATPIPLYSQAFRWFREKHNLRGFIGFRPNTKQFDCHIYDMSLSAEEYVVQRSLAEFNKDPKVGTYEEAETACLEKLIEIVESKSK